MAARRSTIAVFGYSLVAPPRQSPWTPDSIKKSISRSNVATWSSPFAATGVATAAITPVIANSTSHATSGGQWGSASRFRRLAGARTLLRSERGQWIDIAGASRRQITGQQRDGEQDQRQCCQHNRIARPHLIQQRHEQTHRRNGEKDAE